MNIKALLKKNGAKLYDVLRSSGEGSWSTITGEFTNGPQTTIPVLASVQPIGEEDLISIPEGDRTLERFRFYSATALKNIDNVNLLRGDQVTIDGVLFEVESAQHWKNYGRAIIVRVNTDAN